MAVARSPVLYVIAGPNGAGKTTFAREFLPSADVVEFLNADLLAAGLSPLQPAMMAIRSARLLLSRWRELLKQRRSFAFESTLSGRTYATMLREARDEGYEVRLSYLWLPNVAFSLRRVRHRVRMGTTCRKGICDGDFCRASGIFLRYTCRWRTKHFCFTQEAIRRD